MLQTLQNCSQNIKLGIILGNSLTNTMELFLTSSDGVLISAPFSISKGRRSLLSACRANSTEVKPSYILMPRDNAYKVIVYLTPIMLLNNTLRIYLQVTSLATFITTIISPPYLPYRYIILTYSTSSIYLIAFIITIISPPYLPYRYIILT